MSYCGHAREGFPAVEIFHKTRSVTYSSTINIIVSLYLTDVAYE